MRSEIFCLIFRNGLNCIVRFTSGKKVQNLVGKISILLQKAPNLGLLKKTDKKLKIFMIIAEFPKA